MISNVSVAPTINDLKTANAQLISENARLRAEHRVNSESKMHATETHDIESRTKKRHMLRLLLNTGGEVGPDRSVLRLVLGQRSKGQDVPVVHGVGDLDGASLGLRDKDAAIAVPVGLPETTHFFKVVFRICLEAFGYEEGDDVGMMH